MDAVSWIYAAGSLAMLCLGGWLVWAWWTDRMEKAAERKRREDAIAEAAAARHSREERVIRRSREERAIRQAGMRPAPSTSIVQRAPDASRTSTAVITPTPTYDGSSDMMTSMLEAQMLTSGQASMPDPEPFRSGGGGDFGGGGASASWSPGDSSSSHSHSSYSSSDSGSNSSSD